MGAMNDSLIRYLETTVYRNWCTVLKTDQNKDARK